jgi:ABC-type uncharacterized transport system substrate-binding protein
MEGFSFVMLVTAKEDDDDDEITDKVLDHVSAHCTATNYF